MSAQALRDIYENVLLWPKQVIGLISMPNIKDSTRALLVSGYFGMRREGAWALFLSQIRDICVSRDSVEAYTVLVEKHPTSVNDMSLRRAVEKNAYKIVKYLLDTSRVKFVGVGGCNCKNNESCRYLIGHRLRFETRPPKWWSWGRENMRFMSKKFRASVKELMLYCIRIGLGDKWVRRKIVQECIDVYKQHGWDKTILEYFRPLKRRKV